MGDRIREMVERLIPRAPEYGALRDAQLRDFVVNLGVHMYEAGMAAGTAEGRVVRPLSEQEALEKLDAARDVGRAMGRVLERRPASCGHAGEWVVAGLCEKCLWAAVEAELARPDVTGDGA